MTNIPSEKTATDILKLADNWTASIPRTATTRLPDQAIVLTRAEADTKSAETMLVTQARDLDKLFIGLAKRAIQSGDAHEADMLLRLALKAQAQCFRTLQVLGELKSPRPVTFIQEGNSH
jgi:hypothetical protein